MVDTKQYLGKIIKARVIQPAAVAGRFERWCQEGKAKPLSLLVYDVSDTTLYTICLETFAGNQRIEDIAIPLSGSLCYEILSAEDGRGALLALQAALIVTLRLVTRIRHEPEATNAEVRFRGYLDAIERRLAPEPAQTETTDDDDDDAEEVPTFRVPAGVTKFQVVVGDADDDDDDDDDLDTVAEDELCQCPGCTAMRMAERNTP